jgi:hypothetical protein
MATANVTLDLVFDRIGPGLAKELKLRRDEVFEATGKKGKLHQVMTTDIGHPALQFHLAGLTFSAKMFNDGDWGGFHEAVERAYPRYNRTLHLPFPDQTMETSE